VLSILAHDLADRLRRHSVLPVLFRKAGPSVRRCSFLVLLAYGSQLYPGALRGRWAYVRSEAVAVIRGDDDNTLPRSIVDPLRPLYEIATYIHRSQPLTEESRLPLSALACFGGGEIFSPCQLAIKHQPFHRNAS
jgi:hypothetical protein